MSQRTTSALVLTIVLTVVPFAAGALKGDVNEDGHVDAGDVALLVRALREDVSLGGTAETNADVAPIESASVAGDEEVDLADLAVLQRVLFEVDADGDGLNADSETVAGTSPLLGDTDGDAVSDLQEDSDEDGLTNAEELALGTSLGDADSDDDGYEDGAEIVAGTNPLAVDPPGYPADLWAADGDGAITLTWSHGPGHADSYEIWRGDNNELALLTTVSGATTSYVDTTVPANQVSFYWVYGINEGGRSPTWTVHVLGVPHLPTWAIRGSMVEPRFTATSGDGVVTLEWNESPVSDVIGYEIYIRGSTGPGKAWVGQPLSSSPLPIFVSGRSTTSYVITTIPNNESRQVRVRAVTATGGSSLTAAHQVTARPGLSPTGAPPAPLALEAEQLSGYHFTLSWDPGTSNQVLDFSRWRIYRRSELEGSRTLVTTTQTPTVVVPVRPGEPAIFSVATVDQGGLESDELMLSEDPEEVAVTAPSFDLSERTLVVYNSAYDDGDGDGVNDSEEVARYYQDLRGIPSDLMLGIPVTASRAYHANDWDEFYEEIIVPIRDKIDEEGIESIYYIALMYGLPLYSDIANAGNSSLDSWIEVATAAPPTPPAPVFKGDTGFNLGIRHFKAAVDEEPSANDIDNPTPEDVMLFDHTVKRRHTNETPLMDVFPASRVDGFNPQRAKELLQRSLYAERYLSPESGYYHGAAYIERGDHALFSPVTGDFNGDGDPDEAGFLANGDADDLTEEQIAAMYPRSGGGYDLNYAFMRAFFEARGFAVYAEKTAKRIGEAGAEWVDSGQQSATPAVQGATIPAQWVLSTDNNFTYVDKWKWAVGSVGDDVRSYPFTHPKDPRGVIPNWIMETSQANFHSATFGGNALYRGVTAIGGSAAECGGCVQADIAQGLMLDGFPWIDAYSRAHVLNSIPYAFGDPLYRPFYPGKVAELDQTAPPTATVDVRDDSRVGGSPTAVVHWSIDPRPPTPPDLAIATLEYGTTSGLGTSIQSEGANLEVFQLGGTFRLEGLVAGQTYHYRITLRDPVGNTTATSIQTFQIGASGNLLANAGFETDADVNDLPDSWTAAGTPAYFAPRFVKFGDFETDADSFKRHARRLGGGRRRQFDRWLSGLGRVSYERQPHPIGRDGPSNLGNRSGVQAPGAGKRVDAGAPAPIAVPEPCGRSLRTWCRSSTRWASSAIAGRRRS